MTFLSKSTSPRLAEIFWACQACHDRGSHARTTGFLHHTFLYALLHKSEFCSSSVHKSTPAAARTGERTNQEPLKRENYLPTWPISAGADKKKREKVTKCQNSALLLSPERIKCKAQILTCPLLPLYRTVSRKQTNRQILSIFEYHKVKGIEMHFIPLCFLLIPK